jgi:hypothetical protein
LEPAQDHFSNARIKIIKDLGNGTNSIGDRIERLASMVPYLLKMTLLQATWIKNLLSGGNKLNSDHLSEQASKVKPRDENDP